MKRKIVYGLLCMLLVGITACTKDDLPYNGELDEGESNISAIVEFRPLTVSALGRTRTAGDAIKNIENLCVLLYDIDGKLVKKYALTDFTDYTVTDEKREGSATEQKTQHATFQLKVPYGRYYIYTVANMGDLASYSSKIDQCSDRKNICTFSASKWCIFI